MKYFKRSGIYKAANVTFNPKTLDAYSYGWWRFVAKIDGKVIFNNYCYSVTTSKHQRKVRDLLEALGIKIDLIVFLPKSIEPGMTIKQLRAAHSVEMQLQAVIANQKRLERNAKAKQRRIEKRNAELAAQGGVA